MDIKKFIKRNLIQLNLKGNNKKEIIDELSSLFLKSGNVTNIDKFRDDLYKREEISSTALEEGIAIPHCKTNAVKETAIAFGLHKTGVDYDSLDGEPSKLFFMIAAPENSTDEHIECLSALTKLLLNDEFRENLLNIDSIDNFFDLLKNGIEEEVEEGRREGYFVAVTACPTGIAHTYMSAEALQKGAKELNVAIKVETNGSAGVKNQLTKEDINKAEGVIIAADKTVDMGRFNGKKLIMTGTKSAIKNPQKLIDDVKSANIYVANGKSSSNEILEKKGFYKHLMNGVSNMLPFVVGGGILIALSFAFGIKASDVNDPSFHPIAKFLMDTGGGGAFSLMVAILAGFIGQSIGDRPGFMPAMVGGFIANSAGGGFLGGLIAGFVGGYIVLGLKSLFASLPETLEGLKPVLIYPVLGLLLTGLAMKLILINPSYKTLDFSTKIYNII